MITPTSLFDRIGVSILLANESVLTEEQRKLLKEELSKPEYKGASLEELLIALNQQLVVDNPDKRGRVPVESVTGAEFKAWCRYRLAETLGSKASAISQKWAGLSAALMPTISDNEEILASSITLASFAVGMKAEGVCTQAQIDALFSVPDPGWAPRVYAVSVAESITGVENAMLTARDLEGLV